MGDSALVASREHRHRFASVFIIRENNDVQMVTKNVNDFSVLADNLCNEVI
jgi:hypothetical protein